MTIVFDDHLCACPHPPGSHDDGFGCTEEPCPCLAGWSTGQDQDQDQEGIA